MSQDKLIKFYFYTQSGNGLLGNFRNLGEVILLAYFTLHFNNWWLVPIMALIGIPLMALVGWYAVNYMNKIMEKLSVRNGTHYQINQYKIIERNMNINFENQQLLKQILECLRKNA